MRVRVCSHAAQRTRRTPSEPRGLRARRPVLHPEGSRGRAEGPQVGTPSRPVLLPAALRVFPPGPRAPRPRPASARRRRCRRGRRSASHPCPAASSSAPETATSSHREKPAQPGAGRARRGRSLHLQTLRSRLPVPAFAFWTRLSTWDRTVSQAGGGGWAVNSVWAPMLACRAAQDPAEPPGSGRRAGGTRTGLPLLCCRSVAKSCLTLCDPTGCGAPGSRVLHCLLEFAQTHVHRVSDAIQPSHRLPPPSRFVFHLSQHEGLFQ